MAMSKAMGTGRKAQTRATKRMPPMVACAMRACAGRSSMTRAPRTGARSINGKATRKRNQNLLRKDRAVERGACGNEGFGPRLRIRDFDWADDGGRGFTLARSNGWRKNENQEENCGE